MGLKLAGWESQVFINLKDDTLQARPNFKKNRFYRANLLEVIWRYVGVDSKGDF